MSKYNNFAFKQKGLREVFSVFDKVKFYLMIQIWINKADLSLKDGDGTINSSELATVMRSLDMFF